MPAPTLPRAEAIARFVEECLARARRQPHPLRVGIDGRSTSGKSHLADELVAELSRRGPTAVRVSIDEFHRKGHKFRSERNEWTAEKSTGRGTRLCRFPGGRPGAGRARWFAADRPRMLDSANDEFWPEVWMHLEASTVLVSDAGHGFVPALVNLWDYRIWLEVSAETMIARAQERDIAWGASREEVRGRYGDFWVPMDDYYLAACDPVAAAHCVIDNNDLGQPVILKI